MNRRNYWTLSVEVQRRGQSDANAHHRAVTGSSVKADPLSKPGSFRNHPDDPTNPNEERERYLRKCRPLPHF
jgi:hypothetical protein